MLAVVIRDISAGRVAPKERDRVYGLPGLTALTCEDNKLEAKWAFGEALCRDNATLPRWSSTSTTDAFRFRAVLNSNGSAEVEPARA